MKVKHFLATCIISLAMTGCAAGITAATIATGAVIAGGGTAVANKVMGDDERSAQEKRMEEAQRRADRSE